MTEVDLKWVQRLLNERQLEGPVLELGVGYGGETSRELIEAAKLPYFGTDLEKTPAVDFVANFERPEDMAVFSPVAPFGSILVLNVLEHTFDPLRILDNVMSLIKPGGKCAVLTPSIWPLHNYPMDTWRILPNLYEEYAQRRGFKLDRRFFEYAGYGLVEDFRDEQGRYSYPLPSGSNFRRKWSRVIHKIFNTTGRAMFHPSHIAIGALLQKPSA